MKLWIAVILSSLFVAYAVGTPGLRFPWRPCRYVSDCPCGSQCIARFNGFLCGTRGWGRFCYCERGCAVGDIFIPAGLRNLNTYCNQCFCPSDSAGSEGIPSCSRRAWCGVPYPIYQENPNCIYGGRD